MALFLISAVFFLFILLCFLTIIKSKPGPKPQNLPPGSTGWPLLGESLEFLQAGLDGNPERFIRERKEKYKSEVFRTSLIGESMVVFCGTAGLKFLFSNENKLVSIWWPPSVKKLLGDCLINKPGDDAKLIRKHLSYYVGPDALTKLYIQTMDLVTQHHINTYWQGHEQVEVYPTIKLYTFELACRLFMGLEDQQYIAKLAALFNLFLKGVISIPFNFPGTRFYSAMKATEKTRKEILKIVRQRRVALEQKVASPSLDLLSHMIANPIESGKFMPESEIVNNILLLLFAGHDTSSSTLAVLMKYLAELPQVYDKVLQEQLDIASSKEEGEILQWDDIQKMKYSWNVISEVMRIKPPVLGAFREALTDINYAGYDIPKGCKIYWSAAFTHKEESLYPNSNSFDASRFDGAGPIPYSYVAFGGGPRMCLGKEFARLEMLVFLHNIVKNYRWKLKYPNEKIIYDPMAMPAHGLPIHLESHKA